MNGGLLVHELSGISNYIKQFDHHFKYEGDRTLEGFFNFKQENLTSFDSLKPFYKEGTLVIHNGKVGTIFKPRRTIPTGCIQSIRLINEAKAFYEKYIESA